MKTEWLGCHALSCANQVSCLCVGRLSIIRPLAMPMGPLINGELDDVCYLPTAAAEAFIPYELWRFPCDQSQGVGQR